MKICIIGSGISGLSLANMLQENHEVILYEKEKKVGGLIKCSIEEGNLFHRVGGHVFNSKNHEVLDWFWNFFDQKEEFVKAKRNAKIFMFDDHIGYPIENHIYKLPPDIISTIIEELLSLNEDQVFSNFAEFLEGNFGATLYNLYFKPYNEKIWNTDLDQVPLDWLEGKLPMPNIREIILSNILKTEEQNMVHSSFFYPKIGGSQFIVDRLSRDINIISDQEIQKISKTDSGWNVEGVDFDKVIYTGDIRKLRTLIHELSGASETIMEKAKNFQSNGTSNILCYTDNQDYSWLYFPERSFIPHRIIYTGNFSAANNSGIKRTCVVEFSGNCSIEEMKVELSNMPGNLVPIAFNYEPNSYVINTFETRTIVNSIKSRLEADGFFLLGRFAEWEYYNMDKCIEAAFRTVERIEYEYN